MNVSITFIPDFFVLTLVNPGRADILTLKKAESSKWWLNRFTNMLMPLTILHMSVVKMWHEKDHIL